MNYIRYIVYYNNVQHLINLMSINNKSLITISYLLYWVKANRYFCKITVLLATYRIQTWEDQTEK